MSRENKSIVEEQAAPAAERAEKPACWDLVLADMRERDQVGRARYGTPLQPHNGRKPLVDAYQELLDLAVYMRQEIYEQERRTEALALTVVLLEDARILADATLADKSAESDPPRYAAARAVLHRLKEIDAKLRAMS